MNRDEALQLLHAYLDGELDPARCLELEAHLAANPAARAACDRLRALSGAIREKADYHAAPATLHERLRAALPAAIEERPTPSRGRSWYAPAAAFISAAALAVTLTLLLTSPAADERLEQEALASHVRATLGARLADVASSDQHTVKPWLSARLPYSPTVSDFSAQGFELTGARLDYLGGRPVAVLVYQRRKHVIDVFVWPEPGDAATRASLRDGFNLERFARDGMRYWLVSDLNRNELNDLARLLGAP
jgi:anti-sigma factor RsiW